MFAITQHPIDPAALRAHLEDASSGAVVVFEGRVRDHHAGRSVRSLEYEAYAALAVVEGERILGEARERFAISRSVALHRVGQLEIGEVAVWVGVAAAHRDVAFAACRYVIDELKHRVPIWKKEHYVDGSSSWIAAAPVTDCIIDD